MVLNKIEVRSQIKQLKVKQRTKYLPADGGNHLHAASSPESISKKDLPISSRVYSLLHAVHQLHLQPTIFSKRQTVNLSLEIYKNKSSKA